MQVKVSVLGHFGEGMNLLNGQTVKTKIITGELQQQLGEEQVLKFDTHGGWKTLFKAPVHVLRALKNSRNVLIFPAHNGLRIYAPLLSALKGLFKGRKLHYVVIGGWLPEFLSDRPLLCAALKKFDGIYVETNSMKTALEEMGFGNIFVMPNCKELAVLEKADLIYQTGMPLKLCTFSRVMREKGIETAVQAVRKVNEKLGYAAFSLDIFGQVDQNQTEWFEALKSNFPEYVSYGGIVPFDQSVDVLKSYYALLFPTYYAGEGFAGTLIDAFAAGIPVVASDWKYNAEIVEDGKNGIVYSLADADGLEKVLDRMAANTDELNAMKGYCLEKAADYAPVTVVGHFVEHLA